MEQKRTARRLTLWLLVSLLAAVVASSAHASSISLNRSGPYRGCIKSCMAKDNSVYPSSGLSSLWRRNSQQQPEVYPYSAHFEQGKTYTYNVHTWTAALTSFATEQNEENVDYQQKGERLAEVRATAWITPISECEVSMQLKAVQIVNQDENERFDNAEKEAFIGQLSTPILFGYSHGVVTEVCTDVQEEGEAALNLKKSIISALQTTPQLADSNAYPVKVIESDVNGDCETEYIVSKQSAGKFLVEKEKKLGSCENAPRQQTMYSNWKNALLSHSAHQKAFCIQTIEDGQLKAAQCQSAHTLNTGLSHMDVDVIANVELHAQEVFEGEEQVAQVPEQWRRHAPRLMMSSPDAELKRRLLNQENKKSMNKKVAIDGRVALKSILEELCADMIAHGKRPTTKTVGYVQQLAETMTTSSHSEVTFVWKSIVQTGKVCGGQPETAKKLKDIFVDTAASVMNGPAAAIVREQLLKYIERASASEENVLDRQRARYLAVVASFATEPTVDAVRQLLPELFEKEGVDSHVILSLSALLKKTYETNQYGQEVNVKDAAFVESLYQTVLRKVTELLASKGAQAEADIVRLLTALENIDPRAPVQGQERLIKITTDKRLPIAVRVAAIKSAAHITMNGELRRTLLAIFADRVEANEIRIAAYRTLMHAEVRVEELKAIHRVVIEGEKENEDVHNYVCSHQKNLRSSEDWRKRALLPAGAPLFPEPASVANFLLSRNFEYASINEKTQVGAIIEADLIMEAESRVPRAITFNLTVPVADAQIPVVEVTIRQAGFEEALMRRFQAIRDIKSPAHALRELGRIVRMQKKNEQNKKYVSKDEVEKKMQIFINIDGKNVFLWDSVQCGQEHGHQNEEFESVLEQLYKRLPITLDETMVVMPLKHRVRLPTASGIPVTFELNTTIIASYEADIKGMKSSGGESRLEAHIKPTLVIETGVGLVADLPYGQPQQRVAIVNRQISSPTFHVKTSYRADNRQFKIKFLLPENEQIIARYETEFTQTSDAMQQQLKKSGNADQQQIFLALNRKMRHALEQKLRSASKASKSFYYRSGKSAQEVCMPALEQFTGFTYCIEHFAAEDLKQTLQEIDSSRSPKIVYLSQVKLVKTDRSMEGLEFGLTLPAQLYAPEATADEVKFVLHYDTPASSVNRRVNAELVLRLPQSTSEHFLVRIDVDSPVKKFAGQISLQNDRQQKGVRIELTTDRNERQFLLEANAFFKIEQQEQSDRQVKLQLKLQPSARSSLSTFEGDFVFSGFNNKENKKQKVQMKIIANEKQVLEIAFVKAGALFVRDVDCKASLTVQIDLLGAQVHYNSMLNKAASTGTLKSTGELKYNRFLAFSRRVREQVETIGYQVQLTGFNSLFEKEQEMKKIFLHWALTSSQFPQLKQELTYNLKGNFLQQEYPQIEQEFTFKWGEQQEQKRFIRYVQEMKTLTNPRSREQFKWQSTAELEISPLDFHYDAKVVFDIPSEERQITTNEWKTVNRKSGQTTSEGRWVYSILSLEPLKIQSEMDFVFGSDRWFVYSQRDQIEEVKHNHFEGKSTANLKAKNSYWFLRNVDQKATFRYNFQLRDSPANRVPFLSEKTFGGRFWNVYAQLINHLDNLQEECQIEDAYLGRFHQKSQIICTGEESCTTQWSLDREGKMVYKINSERDMRQKTLKLKLETGEENYLYGFGLELATQMTDDVKMVDVKVGNHRFEHQTRFFVNKAEKKAELRCLTKNAQTQEITFQLEGKSVDGAFKVAQLKAKCWDLIDAELEMNNVFQAVRQMKQKRAIRFPEHETSAKVVIRLPRSELEHRTEIKCEKNQQTRFPAIIFNSETRKHERNLFKVKVQSKPDEKMSLSAEYKNGYIAELKLQKNGEHEYTLEADYRIEPKQWTHKSIARWIFNAEKAMHSHFIGRIPFHFRLISLETKSHLGQENIFDAIYRCNEDVPSAEYAHELLFSGRQTHAELKLSRFGFDYANTQYAPKALFTLKSKSGQWFGWKTGPIEHTTELKEVDVERRRLTLISKTVRRGETIAEVECHLAYQRGEQSSVKIVLPNRQISATFVPFQWAQVTCNIDGQWKHQIRFERKAEEEMWNVKVDCANLRKNEQWNGRFSHQCDRHSILEIETPLVRGVIEIQVPAKKLRIDMKGGARKWWAGYEHRFEGQIEGQSKKLTIRSTTNKDSKAIAFVDAELYYATLERASTVKLELEQPIVYQPFKMALTCDPKAACEMTVHAGETWKHSMAVRKIASRKLYLHSETRKDGQTVALMEISELSPKKVVFHVQWDGEQFGSSANKWISRRSVVVVAPFDIKGTVDLEDKEVLFQSHAKRSDRLVKFEAKAKDSMKNVHIECSWDGKRDPTKRALVQVRIQDEASALERLIATIRGDLIERPFNIEVDVPRRLSSWTRSPSASFNIEGELKNYPVNGEQMNAKIARVVENETGDCRSTIELRKGDLTLIKAEAKVNGFAYKKSASNQQKKQLIMKVQSDLKKFDILNSELEMARECTYKQCQTKASAQWGAHEGTAQKSIKFEGANVADALRGQLIINAGQRMLAQTIKFEFIKPESKLQVNVFNQAGRQVDVNVDLARPLQKKFQIVSFVEAIPTIDIEAAYGENSRLVIAASYAEEKKLELSLNWFGQWRRDFKLEALFKCFSSPAIEALLTSRHPAGVDEIEGMLKVAGKEWIAKLSRTFDADRANWNTRALVKANGQKKVDLIVECVTKVENELIKKAFKVHLDGARQATGHITVHLRQPYNQLEMIQIEGGKDAQHPRQATMEFFLGAREHAQVKTGVKVTIGEKAFFGLVHITNDASNASGTRSTSMIRLELPEEIEYVLRNEIEYVKAVQQGKRQIKWIRSELKKKSQVQQQPIYQTVITFEEDIPADMKVMRIEVRSSSFFADAPKQMLIRYNFRPKVCHSLALNQNEQYSQNYENEHQNKKNSFPYGEAKCWRMELIAGELVNSNSQQQVKEGGIRFAAEYIKAPLHGHSFAFNRTLRVSMESNKPEHKSINCALVGHVSPRSFGLVWANRNRHGQQKAGMIYAEKEAIASGSNAGRNMINVYVREQNAHQPSKDFIGEVHFVPQQLRKTMSIAAKFDQSALKRWAVGELPHIREMVKSEEEGSLRKKMIRAAKEELAHKAATLKESFDDELVAPLMAEAKAVGEQLKASEDQLMGEILEEIRKADFAGKWEKIVAMVDLEAALDELERSVVEGWKSVEEKLVAGLERRCQASSGCRKAVNSIRDYEIKRFIRELDFEKKMSTIATKLSVPKELKRLAKDLKKVFEPENDWAEKYEQIEDNEDEQVNRRLLKHGARLLKMAQPQLTGTMMKHLNRISKHFEGENEQKDIDWTAVRRDIYDMATDVIETASKKAESRKSQVEAAPWAIWTSSSNGSGNNYQDYSKYASKWGGKQQKKEKKYFDEQEEPDYKENSQWTFSPKRGEFFYGKQSQLMQTAY